MRLLLAILLIPISALAQEACPLPTNGIRPATVEEIELIEDSMDQMKHQFDPNSVKITSMMLKSTTYCGRMDATRKNGTKMTGYTVYGSWFGGEAVAPIATGAAARKLCTTDKFPKE